jgi:hypothetical protein
MTEDGNDILRAKKSDSLVGLEIFEIKPVILGGDPTHSGNKKFLSREEHVQAVRYWNRIIHSLRVQNQNRPG